MSVSVFVVCSEVEIVLVGVRSWLRVVCQDRSGSHVFHSCMLVSHGDESDGCGCEGSNVVTLK